MLLLDLLHEVGVREFHEDKASSVDGTSSKCHFYFLGSIALEENMIIVRLGVPVWITSPANCYAVSAAMSHSDTVRYLFSDGA
ncbi:hypothetical protein Tco_0871290 [Tanacetum coccineum]